MPLSIRKQGDSRAPAREGRGADWPDRNADDP